MGTEWRVLPPCRRYVVNRSVTKDVPVIQVQRAEPGTTEPSRVREHGLEHRLQLARRAANDTQDLGCRSLLPTSSICLSVNGRTEFRPRAMTPIGVPSRSNGTQRSVRLPLAP